MKHMFRVIDSQKVSRLLESLGVCGRVEGDKLAIDLPEALIGEPSVETVNAVIGDLSLQGDTQIYWDQQRYHCAHIFMFSYIGGRTHCDDRRVQPLHDQSKVVQATYLSHSWISYDLNGNETASGSSSLIVPATPLIRWYWHLVENVFGGEEKEELKDLMFLLKD